MPDLNKSSQRQDAERDGDEQITEGRDEEYFLSIKEVRQHAAE